MLLHADQATRLPTCPLPCHLLTLARLESPDAWETAGSTWRIIPGLGSVVNNHGISKSPK